MLHSFAFSSGKPIRQIIEGAPAAVTPVAFAAGAVVVRPPRIDVLALAPGTLE